MKSMSNGHSFSNGAGLGAPGGPDKYQAKIISEWRSNGHWAKFI